MPALIVAAGSDEPNSPAILARWFANDGQRVEIDQPVCALETDKASVDIAAPSAGILRQFKHEGEPVQIGDKIGRIDPI